MDTTPVTRKVKVLFPETVEPIKVFPQTGQGML